MKSLAVLIVDDEEAICENMADILEMAGHQVSWSTSPSEVWSSYQRNQEHYDLVILDLKMPQMTGVELLKRLRQLNPELPAILTTAYVQDDYFGEHDQQLFEAVIKKPVDIERLLRTVQSREFPIVICVDDDKAFCDNLEEILAEHRIRCECFNDFESAQKQLEKQSFDIALLDIRLPDGSGLKAAQQLKTYSPDTECLLVTGYPSDVLGKDDRLSELGISYVFEKPLHTEDLLETMRKIAKRRGQVVD